MLEQAAKKKKRRQGLLFWRLKCFHFHDMEKKFELLWTVNFAWQNELIIKWGLSVNEGKKIRYAAFWGKTKLSGRVSFLLFLLVAFSPPAPDPTPLLFLFSLPCSSAPQLTHNHTFPLFYIFLPLLASPPSLAVSIQHFKQGLQQSVISVPVWLGAVEAITVVTVDTVLRALVFVDQIQSLVQHLGRESCSRRREAPVWLLLLPPGGGGPVYGMGLLQGWWLPIKCRLQETQEGQGRGGWIRKLFSFLHRVGRGGGLSYLCLLRWMGLCRLLVQERKKRNMFSTHWHKNDPKSLHPNTDDITVSHFVWFLEKFCITVGHVWEKKKINQDLKYLDSETVTVFVL